MNEFARFLRKNHTTQEEILWEALRNRQLNGYKFRRQYTIAPYIVDFCCIEHKLIVELDGAQHADLRHVVKDVKRDSFLSNQGFTILRFWNAEVDQELEAVLNTILNRLENSVTQDRTF